MQHHQTRSSIMLVGSSWHKRYILPRKVSHVVPLISSWPSLTMDSEWERAHQDHTALASHQPQPVLSRLWAVARWTSMLIWASSSEIWDSKSCTFHLNMQALTLYISINDKKSLTWSSHRIKLTYIHVLWDKCYWAVMAEQDIAKTNRHEQLAAAEMMGSFAGPSEATEDCFITSLSRALSSALGVNQIILMLTKIILCPHNCPSKTKTTIATMASFLRHTKKYIQITVF